jgi:hypothetical protein
MDLFNSGFFWFFEGIMFCAVLAGFRAWMKDRGVAVTFWKWIVFVAWLALFGFTLAFVGTSLGENEPTAAIRGGIVFGIITIIVGAVLMRFFFAKAGSTQEGV